MVVLATHVAFLLIVVWRGIYFNLFFPRRFSPPPPRFWLLGFLAFWLLGFSASWLFGFSASRLLGFSAFCWFMRLLVAFWLWLFASSAFPVPLRQVGPGRKTNPEKSGDKKKQQSQINPHPLL